MKEQYSAMKTAMKAAWLLVQLVAVVSAAVVAVMPGDADSFAAAWPAYVAAAALAAAKAIDNYRKNGGGGDTGTPLWRWPWGIAAIAIMIGSVGCAGLANPFVRVTAVTVTDADGKTITTTTTELNVEAVAAVRDLIKLGSVDAMAAYKDVIMYREDLRRARTAEERAERAQRLQEALDIADRILSRRAAQ